MQTTLSPDLASRLRSATRELHAEVERTGVMADLLAGRLSRAGFAGLLRNLHALYAALEPALEGFGPLPVPPLQRTARLAEDLAVLHGPDWRIELPVAKATDDYVARLHALAARQAPELAAHAYVRYLGDLHGGQVLARLVAKRYGLQGDAGIRFYDFGDEARVQRLREDLRGALVAMQPGEAAAEAIVEEACWAFRQHARLFRELA
ncbi:MAG: biliverdin-producing heme oxygenase [Rubrivivax sp.]